jgi:ribosomal protein S13
MLVRVATPKQIFFKPLSKNKRVKKLGFKFVGISKVFSSLVHNKFGVSIRNISILELLKKNFSNMTLRAQKRQAIKHLIYLKTYRGWRHERHLPVRGQSARTNAKTRRKRGVQ